MSNQPVLEIKHLNVDYGLGDQAVHAVSDVSLTLHHGEVLGLAGESGSGKSTLAYGLTRLLPPPGVVRSGSVIYHSQTEPPVDIMKLTPDEAKEVMDFDDQMVSLPGASPGQPPGAPPGRTPLQIPGRIPSPVSA